jgi:hypothetical protein
MPIYIQRNIHEIYINFNCPFGCDYSCKTKKTMIKHCYECNDNNEAGELLDIIQLNDDYTVMDLIESTDNLINILKKVIITQELMQFQQNTIDDIINYIKSKGVSDIMHINYIIEFFFDLDTNDQIYINDTQRDIIKKLWNKRHNLQ